MGIDYDSEVAEGICKPILIETKYLVENDGVDTECRGGHFLRIDPNGGTYKGNSNVQQICMYKDEEYPLTMARKAGTAFKKWSESGEKGYLNGYTVTMGVEDIDILAVYENNPTRYVAQWEDYYYLSLSDAFDDVDDNSDIKIIKTSTGTATNTKNVTVDMNGFNYNGTITNDGTLQVFNDSEGKASSINSNNVAIINNGTLTIGKNDENVINNLTISSSANAIEQNGTVNYYDNAIQGIGIFIGSDAKIAAIPAGYKVLVTNNDGVVTMNLVTDTSSAIAATKGTTPVYFTNLQDAINLAKYSKETVYMLKDVNLD
jgi:hypothetical protein